MEFILASHIKVHPMAFIHPEKLTKEELKEVAEVIKGYSDGQTYFIEKLAEVELNKSTSF
jgi:pyruvate,water dikinase